MKYSDEQIRAEKDVRIRRCMLEGRHDPQTDGVRHINRSPLDLVVPDATLPADQLVLTTYMVYRCRACNMEERR